MSNVQLLEVVIHQQPPNGLRPNNLKLGYQKKKKNAKHLISIGDLYSN